MIFLGLAIQIVTFALAIIYMHSDLEKISVQVSFNERLKAYGALLKTRLSTLVVFSGAMAYLLAATKVDPVNLLWFAIGGFMVTGGANIINQVIEVEYDKLMSRTNKRPLPTNVLTKQEAIIFCVLLSVTGLYIHFVYLNELTALFSLVSLILYGFVYTPLKRVGPIAVFVGAIPGALPPLIGWVAYSGEITLEPLILFGIQFIWQFPHFWAIAWVSDDDYKKAGFKLLPSKGGRNASTAFNIMTYTLFLIPISLFPHYIGLTGVSSAIVVTIAGLMFLSQTFYLMKKCDIKAAKWMMFGSFIYLPVVQIAFVLDKI